MLNVILFCNALDLNRDEDGDKIKRKNKNKAVSPIENNSLVFILPENFTQNQENHPPVFSTEFWRFPSFLLWQP